MTTAPRTDERESVPCIFCGTSATELYATAKSLYDERRFTVVQCRQCELVFTSPRIANKAAEIEHHAPPAPSQFNECELRRHAAAAEVQLARLERYIRPGRVLDFGCGDGTLVHQAGRRGWDGVGADIDRALIQSANAHWNPKRDPDGDRLVCDNVDVLIRNYGPTFDAIVSKQVFEHLTNPLEFLVKLRSLLRPGGIVLVDVPSLWCLGERMHKGSSLDPTAHLYYFTPPTMRTLFQRAGFDVLRCTGSPNMLGLYYRICRPIGLADLAAKLARATDHIPLPQIGRGLCAIGRMRGAADAQ